MLGMQQAAHLGDQAERKNFSVYAASLGRLLDLKHYHLVIPSYQRPYEWKSGEVEVLLRDLKKSQEMPVPANRNLLLGSIILYQHSEGDALQVVDGQQRLTTLMLIYSVLFHRLKELDRGSTAELESFSDRFYLHHTSKRILELNNALAGDAADSADSIVATWGHLTDFASSVFSRQDLNSKNDKYTGRWRDICNFVEVNFKTSEAVKEFRDHLDTHVYVSITSIQHLGLALQSFVRCNSAGKKLA